MANINKKREGFGGLDIGKTVRDLREAKGLRGVDFCKRVKGLNPKMLTAVEKGRIKNPSIKTLSALSQGLQISVSELFKHAETAEENAFYLSDAKSNQPIEINAEGVKFWSLTPLAQNLFCGKLQIASGKSFSDKHLNLVGIVFIQSLVGDFSGVINGRETLFRAGEGVSFFGNGARYFIQNTTHRLSSLLLVTSPSCISETRSQFF